MDCATTARVGRQEDGGKWVCDPQQLPPGAVVYSFGVGDDASFDVDMAGLFGGQVYMFDPAPSVAVHFGQAGWDGAFGTGRVYYQAMGVGETSSDTGLVLEKKTCPVRTVADLARSLQHSHVPIIKVDIEGGEYAVLKQVLAANTLEELGVQQLLVEFHLWTDDAFVAFVGLIDALSQRGYLIFRKEFNPWNARCAEYAFVKVQDPHRVVQ